MGQFGREHGPLIEVTGHTMGHVLATLVCMKVFVYQCVCMCGVHLHCVCACFENAPWNGVYPVPQPTQPMYNVWWV